MAPAMALAVALLLGACGGTAPTAVPTDPTMGPTTSPAATPATGAPSAQPSAGASPSVGSSPPTPGASGTPATPTAAPTLVPGPIGDVAARLPAELAGRGLEGDVVVASGTEVVTQLDLQIANAPADEAGAIAEQRDRLVENGLAGRATLNLAPPDGRPLEVQIDVFATADGAAAEFTARRPRYADCERIDLGRTALRVAAFHCPVSVGAAAYAIAQRDTFVLTVATLLPAGADLAAEFDQIYGLLVDLARIVTEVD